MQWQPQPRATRGDEGQFVPLVVLPNRQRPADSGARRDLSCCLAVPSTLQKRQFCKLACTHVCCEREVQTRAPGSESMLIGTGLMCCVTRGNSRPKHGTTTCKHPHALQGKLAHEPTAAPHDKASPNDSEILFVLMTNSTTSPSQHSTKPRHSNPGPKHPPKVESGHA
jgi:hypothetical protein